ncbi:NUDIX domain-containing protein [Pseudoroseicyclus tamaricis]|uniref:ADP-ribose pyrophosphatase n=1 Tax=Pseudoroseicyclus tamaricis TaxID=2705421 RepID=A0A6B2JVR4_9RHOB|nr:NUDIX domain-containing protein [Pseudoroseicyclus tamaricis]NDV00739.1 NUDIX domain-containing protein [Pseudoroseicyclus tamaricis]
MSDLFLYGTLRDAALFDAVAGEGPGTTRPATLPGWAAERAEGVDLPVLVERAGAEVEGVLAEGLSEAQRARLDAYELPWGYSLGTVEVEAGQGPRRAEVYLPPADQLSSGEAWSLAHWQEGDGPRSRLAAGEIERNDPRLSPEELRAQWRMMEVRADARLRAAAGGPATVRHAPAEGDFSVRPTRPLTGGFFKFAGLELEHRRFDGGRETQIPREVFTGVDAALVLPWDPETRLVLMVEQFRPGPAWRGDPNPWVLEPVAGIIDPGETPEASARREAVEEAGITIGKMEKAFGYYCSPGTNTDFFHCFLGETRLEKEDVWYGGLDEEGEDIRVHVMSLERALGLLATGEINVGPLVALLLALQQRTA